MRYRGLQALGLFLTLLLLFIHSLHAQQSDWSGVNDNWRPIGGFFPPGAQVSATSRSPGNLDLFITGNDGRVYTSWWYEGNDWSGVNDNWAPIGGFFPPGAPLGAVARNPNQLDLFIAGNDGRVYTSWWTQVTPSEPRPQACLGLTEDQVPADWSEMLRAHNERRAQHCAAPLTWSNELAAAAQAYADRCILNMHGAVGENMADHWAETNGNPVLPALSDRDAFEKTWYCELNNYDFNNPQFRGGFTANCRDVNGHFTQVVWRDTCQLGCGRATCNMTDDQGVVHQGTHWVCRYNPPGNVNANVASVLRQQVRQPPCE